MGVIDWLFGRPEVRAGAIEMTDELKAALVGTDDSQDVTIDREKVMEIPSVQGCVDLIAGTIASLPIKLYKKEDGGVEEIKDDDRLRLLNDETGDTLTATQFWRSMIEDYLLGKGGYAFINRSGSSIKSIHYVSEDFISFHYNFDPIFKDYQMSVNGKMYYPHEFLKILRHTKNGYDSEPIWKRGITVLSMAYGELLYEKNLVARGGNRKGFLQSDIKLGTEQLRSLKDSYRKLYSNSADSVVVLNKGVTFKEASNTAVEMQLNENKTTNAQEICKLFGVPVRMLIGNATPEDVKGYIRTISAIINDIECSLDRDLLLETEKGLFYWAFDTKELTRGDIKERYEAYQIALKNNFLQIDEVREAEDYEPLGFEWITLGLDSVLYNPKTGTIYTPNNDAVQTMTEKGNIKEKTDERADGKNVIVCGAPCSGKTTYVQNIIKPGDIVVDLDAIKSAITFGHEHDEIGYDTLKIMLKIRDLIYSEIEERHVTGTAYIITTEWRDDVLEEWQMQLNADLYRMPYTMEECLERLEADATRTDKELFKRLISEWYEKKGGGKNES